MERVQDDQSRRDRVETSSENTDLQKS